MIKLLGEPPLVPWKGEPRRATDVGAHVGKVIGAGQRLALGKNVPHKLELPVAQLVGIFQALAERLAGGPEADMTLLGHDLSIHAKPKSVTFTVGRRNETVETGAFYRALAKIYRDWHTARLAAMPSDLVRAALDAALPPPKAVERLAEWVERGLPAPPRAADPARLLDRVIRLAGDDPLAAELRAAATFHDAICLGKGREPIADDTPAVLVDWQGRTRDGFLLVSLGGRLSALFVDAGRITRFEELPPAFAEVGGATFWHRLGFVWKHRLAFDGGVSLIEGRLGA